MKSSMTELLGWKFAQLSPYHTNLVKLARLECDVEDIVKKRRKRQAVLTAMTLERKKYSS